MKNSKKITALVTAAILAATALTGCGKKAEDNTTIKIGYGTVLCQTPLQIAIEKGYFDDEGLDYEVVKLDGLITEYVGSGQVDAGYGLASKFIQPIDNGLPITMTAGIHTGCIKILVKEGSGIDTIADLKGKTIGCNGLAEAPCVLTKRALYAAGVDVSANSSEVEFAIFSNPDLALALDNDSVDAIALVDPAATIAVNKYGYKVLLDQASDPAYKDEYCCATFVTNAFAKEHPEIAAKYTRAVMKASAWVEENPYEAAAFLIEKEYLSGDPEVFGAILDSYNFTPSVQGGYDAVVKNVEEFVTIGLLDESTDQEAFIKKAFTFLDGVEESYAASASNDGNAPAGEVLTLAEAELGSCCE